MFDVGIDTKSIIAFLVSVICASVCSLFDKKNVALISCALQVFISFYVPEMVLFSSVWIYCLVRTQSYFVPFVSMIFAYEGMGGFEINNKVMLYALCFLAMYIAEKTRWKAHMNSEMIRLRDDAEENAILLKKKNKRLIEKQDQDIYVATLKERNRIAREIHDNVGHMLTRSILQLGALMTIHKQEPISEELIPIKENLDQAMNSIRNSVHDLHDESIDTKQSITEIIEPLYVKFLVRFDYDIKNEMSRECKYAVIGLVKEAVSNIIKYSSKSIVDITLREHPAMYQIIIYDHDEHIRNVEDQGISKTNGMGIKNMYDRVDSVNGNITITNVDGYKIFVIIPKYSD